MSTRGAIARYTGEGFTGVYHHWDSYPEGLGATLWELYHGRYVGDLGAMLAELIDAHPAGWSTINGADWSQPAGYREHGTDPCATCGECLQEHYRQYLGDRATEQDRTEMARGNFVRLGHAYRDPQNPRGPQCYCHGTRRKASNLLTQETAGGCGVEYVYAFDARTHKMYILSSYDSQSGNKMVGMFGCGDPDSLWAIIATIDLRGLEPRWAQLQSDALAPLMGRGA